MQVRKPLWRSGVALMPQHFQFQDAYHENLIRERISALNEYAWGLSSVSIDAERLRQGEIVVRNLSAILADGTSLETDAEIAIPPRRLDLGEFAAVGSVPPGGAEKGGVTVYIGLPRSTFDAVGAEGKGLQRFSPRSAKVSDFNTGQGPVDLLWAAPNPAILFDGERLDQWDALPIGRVARNPSGQFELVEHYIPPILRIRASKRLELGIRSVAQQMAMKQAGLIEVKKRPGDAAGPGALRFWLLTLLGSFIPRVSDLLDREVVHPHCAYEVLAELWGALSTFDPAPEQWTIPRFQYGNLAGTFWPLLGSIGRVLENLNGQRYVRLPLRKHENGVYFAELNSPGILRHEFYLGVAGANEEQVREQAGKLIKIAAWEEIGVIVNANVGGVRLSHDYRPPSALPIRSGSVYFRLERTGQVWENAVRYGNLAIYQPVDPAHTTIELLAVDAEQIV